MSRHRSHGRAACGTVQLRPGDDIDKVHAAAGTGALGNGLRIVIGCIVATGGTIEITSHNRRTLLRPAKVGPTEIIETAAADYPLGTCIVVTFGAVLPEDDED